MCPLPEPWIAPGLCHAPGCPPHFGAPGLLGRLPEATTLHSSQIRQHGSFKRSNSASSDTTSTGAPEEADALLTEAVEVSINGGALTESEAGSRTSRVASRAERSAESIAAGFTTLMVRNLPHAIVQSDLARELDKSGFENLYDFLYMPSVFDSGRGKGYAFVNFVTSEVAYLFMSLWHKSHRFTVSRNKKTLDISVACIQGRDANVLKWDDSKRRRVLNPNYRPIVQPNMALGSAGTTKAILELAQRVSPFQAERPVPAVHRLDSKPRKEEGIYGVGGLSTYVF